MLKIILCDDDPFILRLGSEKIQEILTEGSLDAQLAAIVQSSGELFSFFKSNSGDYLVFLDLDFGQGRLNGIDIAKALKQADKDIKIVFTTNHYEMALDVLKSGTEPFGFLEKSTDFSVFSRGYRRYIHMAVQSNRQTNQDLDTIAITVDTDEQITLRRDDIVFVETEKNISHGITYHTLNGSTVTIISTLDAEQTTLGNDFIRVHRSFLINKKHILCMNEGYIKLSTQQEIPCAFRKRTEVKRWLEQK